ncbi:hypothetical protein F2230_21785 [Salmonella enterica]|nr:hypothetical protein [Salmonella enterica]EDR5805984.1 hypothetical protein [Salmonella enterica subsp. enterica serovar Saintpaul]
MAVLSVRELISVIKKAQADIAEIDQVLPTQSPTIIRFLNDAKAMQRNFILSMIIDLESHPEEWSDQEAAEIAAIQHHYNEGLGTAQPIPYIGPIEFAR